MSDPINPMHYKHLPVEAIDIIMAAIERAPTNAAAYLQGQVLKYLLRCWEKKGIEDLRKAKWYLDRLVASFDEVLTEASGVNDEPSEDRPPKGWRKMEIGEDIKKGDKFWFEGNWKHYKEPGLRFGKLLSLHKTHIREIETPIDNPALWTPKIGERVILKATGAIYRIESYNEDSKQYSMQGWPGSCVNLESIAPWFETEPPPKQYREPTRDDLKNGAIECEYRDNDGEQWRSGLLVYILSGSMRFLCTDKMEQLSGQWEQCRIEAAE